MTIPLGMRLAFQDYPTWRNVPLGMRLALAQWPPVVWLARYKARKARHEELVRALFSEYYLSDEPLHCKTLRASNRRRSK